MLFSLVALVVYAVVCVGILLGSYYFLDILTPWKLTMILKEGGWNAAILATANLLAVAFIIIFAMLGQPVSVEGIIYATVFAVVGTIFQGLGLFVIRRVWLRKTNVDELLASPRVTPPGLFLAAAALATGLTIAVAVH